MKYFVIVTLIIVSTLAYSQENNAFPQTKSGLQPPQNNTYFPDSYKPTKEVSIRKWYLGFGSGINNVTGILGPTVEFNPANNFTAFAGAGIGSWGYKLSAGARFYLKYPTKSAFSLSWSCATGANNLKSEFETTQKDANNHYIKQEVIWDALPVYLINVSWLRYWRIGRNARINMELGYGINLLGKSLDNVNIQTKDVVLNDASKTVLTHLIPSL